MAKKLSDLEDTAVTTAIPRLGTPAGEAAAAKTIEAYRPENLVDRQGVSHSPATVRERTGRDLAYKTRDTLANDWGAGGGDAISPRMDTVFDDVSVRRTRPVNSQTPGIGDAEAATPAATALPPGVGPRYKRVANPYENNAPGYGGTSMIATRAGEIVDLSGRSDIGTPGKSAAYPTGAAPGFVNQDLVDLYGGPAKSAMTDEQWRAQIDQNSAMPAGWVWDQATGKAIPTNPSVKNAWQTADGKPIMAGPAGKQTPMVQQGTDAELSFGAANHTSLPAIDLSGPGAMIQSALPYAAQAGAERRKSFERQQQNQLFKEKYGIDLKRMELGIQAQTAASNAARNQAEIGKLNAETAAVPGKGTAAGSKISLEQAKHMTELYQMSPDAFDAIAGIHDQPEEERIKLRPQKLREMLGYGGTIQSASAAPASASAPPVQGARQSPRDGKWYVADPNRPGKYLMVNQ